MFNRSRLLLSVALLSMLLPGSLPAQSVRKKPMSPAGILDRNRRIVEAIPYQAMTFYPLSGTYVMRLEGHMDLNTFKNTLHTVEFVPLQERHEETYGKFKLDRVLDSRSILLIKKDGGTAEGGFGVLGKSMELPRETWLAGVRLDCPVEISALELKNAGRVRERLEFPSTDGPISIAYRAVPTLDAVTGKARTNYLNIEFKTENVDFVTTHRYSSDFKIFQPAPMNTKQPAGRPNARAVALSGAASWERYILVVAFQGLKPYANVYEIGKGWRNSTELVEKLFRRDKPTEATAPGPQ